MTIPRPEHPKPQAKREAWLNLNGIWTYQFDFGLSGTDRKLFNSRGFSHDILIPFCPESTLSGVAYHDFIPAIWYHRTICIPRKWDGKRVFLHFGAVDFECEVYVDGYLTGKHIGGSASFSLDITQFVQPGSDHQLVVHAKDDCRNSNQASGKQSMVYYSHNCFYSRITGIWQTVWLEARDTFSLEMFRIITDIDSGRITTLPTFSQIKQGLTFSVQVKTREDGQVAGEISVPVAPGIAIPLEINNLHLWSPEDPYLYDLNLILSDETVILDLVSSYFGARKIHCEGDKIFLNNKHFYQRLVLDQGYYKEGLWTAPSDEALKRDIELSLAAGFNGARLHQKVFEERFHYWADQLGYLTWAESSSWGLDVNSPTAARYFLSEWREIVERDANHPSIIVWTPLNETRVMTDPDQHRWFHLDCYHLTHGLDSTRLVNDASGYVHQKTDIWTVHSYIQDPLALQETLTPTTNL